MKKQYLFLFTFGPVQTYIEQARKTHDLYAGSRLLSNLTECAIKHIKEIDNEAKIKFPYLLETDENPSFPNRCIASVSSDNIAQFGQKIKHMVLDDYVYLSWNCIEVDNQVHSVIEQLKQQLEIYWVALPYEEKSYRVQYSRLEQIMGAVKQIRPFMNLEEKGRDKCTSCGERNSLISFNMVKEKSPFVLRKNEMLCAVCYAKRKYLYKLSEPFPSNSEIALAFWLYELKKEEEGRELYTEFSSIFSNSSWSKEFLFIDSINKQELINAGETKVDVNTAKRKLEKIYAYMKNKTQTMHKYYALVAFDGDEMGKLISGSYFRSDVDLENAQNDTSKYLRDFACWLQNYLVYGMEQQNCRYDPLDENAKACGSVIYAGGDDFLGMIPLNKLFLVLQRIREEFKIRVNDNIQNYMEDSREFTISAGICIAHFKTPLGRVVEEVRIQEKIAKKSRQQKNALSFSVMKRSGEKIQAVMPWTTKDGKYVLDELSQIQKAIENGDFSAKFIRVAQHEISTLVQMNKKISKFKNLVQSEIGRLIERSYNERIELQIDIENRKLKRRSDIEKMKNWVTDYLRAIEEADFRYQDFIYGLLIMDFLRREIHED